MLTSRRNAQGSHVAALPGLNVSLEKVDCASVHRGDYSS